MKGLADAKVQVIFALPRRDRALALFVADSRGVRRARRA
jgi:hypothetical protein